MATEIAKKIWHNGTLIDWNDAHIHIMSHVVHYASALFEGIRCYATPAGASDLSVARAHPAAARFVSCLSHGHGLLGGRDCCGLRRGGARHEFKECYLRPLIFRGYGTFGVNPLNNPIEAYIASWVWEKYLGHDSVEQGVDVCVASWARMQSNTLPATAKAAANYMNSQLIKMEAITNGFVEGIALDTNGLVSEGSGENIFLVKDGQLHTPPLSSAILCGITRDSVMQIARGLGYEVKESVIPRASLYIADEVFFTGTAAEVTPIRSIDRIKVGSGARGAHHGSDSKRVLRHHFRPQGSAGDWLTFTNGAAKK